MSVGENGNNKRKPLATLFVLIDETYEINSNENSLIHSRIFSLDKKKIKRIIIVPHSNGYDRRRGIVNR